MPVFPGPNVIFVYSKVRLPARFATDNGIDKVVTVKAGNPGPRQTWFVQPVEDKTDVYTITVGEFPPELGTPGFRREVERGPDDVFNSPLPGEWRIVPVPGLDEVFEVHPNNHIIGVEELLGTDAEDKVVIKIFPIIVDPFEKPAWIFRPVN